MSRFPPTPQATTRSHLVEDLQAWVRGGQRASAWWQARHRDLERLATAAQLAPLDPDFLDPDTLLDLLAGLMAREADGTLASLSSSRGSALQMARQVETAAAP